MHLIFRNAAPILKNMQSDELSGQLSILTRELLDKTINKFI